MKFDWHIDYLQFSSQLFKVKELKDDPILVKGKFEFEKIENYFIRLAKQIGQKVLKK